MTIALIGCFALLAFAHVIAGLRSSRTYEFPFFAGCVMLGWVVPEMLSEWNAQQFIPERAFQVYLLMACLCSAAIALPALLRRRSNQPGRPAPVATNRYDSGTLRVMTVVLFVIGIVFFVKLRTIPWEQLKGGWSGAPVMYFFFSRVLRYAFAMALFLWLDKRDRLMAVIALCCAATFLESIIFYGRRADSLRFVLTILLALYFVKSYRLPRPIMMIGVVIGALLVSAVALYRPHVRGQHDIDWGAVSEIDLQENMVNVINGGSGAEIRKATHIVGAIQRRGEFNLGSTYWDAMINEFVPRQLVGHRAKQSFMLTSVTPEQMAYEEFGYIGIPGATPTGFSDAYASFWFFGCFVFSIVTWTMHWLFQKATTGDLRYQVLYTVILVDALLAITHNTNFALARATHALIFVVPCFVVAHAVWSRRAHAYHLYQRAIRTRVGA